MRPRPLWPILLVAVPAALIVGSLVWLVVQRYEPLPSPDEGAAMLVADASVPGRPPAVATCRAVRPGGETFLDCRMRDPDGRYGTGRVWIGTRKVSGYRGTTEIAVVRRSHDFPLSADGVADVDVEVPGVGPGPADTDRLAATLAVALLEPLRAAGYDEPAFPQCPPVAPGRTVRCAVEPTPGTAGAGIRVEVSRPGAGAEHHVRLRVRPRP